MASWTTQLLVHSIGLLLVGGTALAVRLLWRRDPVACYRLLVVLLVAALGLPVLQGLVQGSAIGFLPGSDGIRGAVAGWGEAMAEVVNRPEGGTETQIATGTGTGTANESESESESEFEFEFEFEGDHEGDHEGDFEVETAAAFAPALASPSARAFASSPTPTPTPASTPAVNLVGITAAPDGGEPDTKAARSAGLPQLHRAIKRSVRSRLLASAAVVESPPLLVDDEAGALEISTVEAKVAAADLDPIEIDPAEIAPAEVTPVEVTPAKVNERKTVATVLALVPWRWIGVAGTLLLAAFHLLRLARTRRLLARCQTIADAAIIGAWNEVACGSRLRGRVRLLASHELDAPACWGFFRPCLVLPADAGRNLDGKTLRFAMQHELVHLERRDSLVAALQALLTACFWFHPVAWWISRELDRQRELSCDLIVVLSSGARRSYALALIEYAKVPLSPPGGR